MSKSITIPDTSSRYRIFVGGKWYEYEGGTTVTVPDEVADVILGSVEAFPKEAEKAKDPWIPKEVEGGYLKQADLSNCFKIQSVMPCILGVNAGAYSNGDTSASKTGYTPIGIVGHHFDHAGLSLEYLYLKNGNIFYKVYNYTDERISNIISYFDVLYVKA